MPVDPHGNMDNLQMIVGLWGEETFGIGHPESCLWHMVEELRELIESGDPEEAADCALLLLQYAYRRGFSLYDAVIDKHRINRQRKWGEPDENGVVKHIEEASHEE